MLKESKNEFSASPYKAGENLLDPKCYCSLNVCKETLDQLKSSNLLDKNYDISLGKLEDQPPEPSHLKKFNKSSFSYDDIFEMLLTCRNASVPDLNDIP